MSTLFAIAPVLVALWGWACLALAVADRGPFAALALAGFAGSTLVARAPVAAAGVELVAGAVLAMLAVAAPAGVHEGRRLAFVVVGALLVVSARAISEVGRRARA